MSSWTCNKCTYVHSEAEATFLCCAICSAERPKRGRSCVGTGRGAGRRETARETAGRGQAAREPEPAAPGARDDAPRRRRQRRADAAARAPPPAPPRSTRPTPPRRRQRPQKRSRWPRSSCPRSARRRRRRRPARPPLKAPRTAAAWPIQAQRTVALRFSMARDGEGRVRASIERGGPQAPAAGRRRVFEAERTCKLALAHEGKAACDVKIHLTLDTAGDDGAAWRDRRTYTGARAAGGLGLLQSHLQKCIRRGTWTWPVRSAHELAGITFGPTDPAGVKMLVRRLPVIAVEDSAALPCVLPAVWYMMALSPTEKSPATYKPTTGDVLVLCACAAQLAAHGNRDRCGNQVSGAPRRAARRCCLHGV